MDIEYNLLLNVESQAAMVGSNSILKIKKGNSIGMGYRFSFGVVWDNLPILLSGLGVTFLVAFVALAMGLVIGTAFGVMRTSRSRLSQGAAAAYVSVFRNTPTLVQLIWVYYCLPIFLGIELSSIASCTIALGLGAGAYTAEIIRGGIQGIDRGQWEAAATIGLSRFETMRKIILPQALRKMIAPLVNEIVSLVKFSSLVSILGVEDLTYVAQLLATTTFRPIELYTFLGLEYYVICTALSYLAAMIERKLARKD
ncbi:amino acid ABC transporter permease [Rhizobium puerariae]|uniref:Amino acid ABC transporter permease n=1 Tax=Rhizobium puerariae TaxID=1585791 RepID=A0ABV6AA02_9HYPH